MALMTPSAVKRVLVIGGGDGGVLREFARYPFIEELHICELDEMVIDISKKFIPQTSIGFSDPRVHIHIEDGFVFLERMTKDGKLFDVIVADLSDPVGPAGALFTASFLKLTANALSPHGVACMQAESMWLHLDIIADLVKAAKENFESVKYAQISVPSYPSGTIGALVMAKTAPATPEFNKQVMDTLQYYSPELHHAQFVLPRFVTQRLASL
jgi:spermidine synthase